MARPKKSAPCLPQTLSLCCTDQFDAPTPFHRYLNFLSRVVKLFGGIPKLYSAGLKQWLLNPQKQPE